MFLHRKAGLRDCLNIYMPMFTTGKFYEEGRECSYGVYMLVSGSYSFVFMSKEESVFIYFFQIDNRSRQSTDINSCEELVLLLLFLDE